MTRYWQPGVCFCLSSKRLITHFYPLLPLCYTSKKYLNNGDRWLTKTKSKLYENVERIKAKDISKMGYVLY
jgi:hypothetical protein